MKFDLPDPVAAGGPAGVPRFPKLAFQPVFVIFSAFILFTIFWYFGRKAFFETHFWHHFADTELKPLYPFFYFCVMSVVFRMALPALLVKLVLKRPLRDFGYALHGSGRGGKLYLAFYLAMVPIVLLVSTTTAFQSFYPQFREMVQGGEIVWWHVVVFELFYGLLFLSGESFWRGYIVFGLEETLGDYAVLVMVIPYVMSHYEKPFGETMGAFVAGTILGLLALRHRNFWLGVAVHWGVAMTMDLAALWQTGVTLVY